jgi:GH15 family glucan-1,4-alpha-glucosidase
VRCQHPAGYFVHRHFPSGDIGSTWHPPPFIQVDQTGTVLAATWHHFKRQGDVDALLSFWPMVKSAANFLTDFRDASTGLPAPSFDLWEERKGIHTYSTAVVVHALERAARIAEELGKDPTRWRTASKEIQASAIRFLWDEQAGHFVRSLEPRDEKADASTLMALKLGLVDWKDSKARATVEHIENRLRGEAGRGGVARYEGDQYYGPENPWIITTLWLAEAKLHLGARRTPTGLLAEQVDGADGSPRSAVPLVWSHSTYVEVVNKYRDVVASHAKGGEQ